MSLLYLSFGPYLSLLQRLMLFRRLTKVKAELRHRLQFSRWKRMTCPGSALPSGHYPNSLATAQHTCLLVNAAALNLLRLLPHVNITVQYRRSYRHLPDLPSRIVLTVPIQQAHLTEEVRKPCRAFHQRAAIPLKASTPSRLHPLISRNASGPLKLRD